MRLVFLVSFLLIPLSLAGQQGQYHFIQLGLSSPLTTFGKGPLQHNSLLLHLGYVKSGGLSGISLGPVTVLEGRAVGWMAGIFQQSSSEIWGLQTGIGVQAEGLYGVSINLANLNYGSMGAGWQTGAFNMNVWKYAGLQIGGINTQPVFQGVQWGWLNLGQQAFGVQTGLINLVDEVNGLQIGLINILKQGRGLSLGIFTWIEKDSIQPLSLITIVRDRPLYLALGVDSDNLIQFYIRHGARHIYNTYSLAKLMNYPFFQLGWGWGLQTVGTIVEWHLEVRARGFILQDRWLRDAGFEFKGFVLLRAYERFAVSLGLSYHLLRKDPSSDTVLQYFPAARPLAAGLWYHWPGVFAAWQF